MNKFFTPIFLITILISTCLVFRVSAQNTSNSGTNFWVGYTGHIDYVGNTSTPPREVKMNLYLTSKVNTTATVSIPGLGISNSYTVLANSVTVAPVSQSAYVPYNNYETVQDRGIQVVSEHPIVVYSHIYSGSRSAATLVLPTNTLGREYFAASYTTNTNSNTTNFSEFMVVATEDNTTVEIVPKADTRRGQKAGQPFTIELNKGQVFQVHSAFDLTGSKIVSTGNGGNSCKKIAVFSGHTFVAIDPTPGCNVTGDNLYQQLYPLSAWGNNFATAPLKNRPRDIFRVMAGSHNTNVIVNGGMPQLLNAGEYFDFPSSSANYITADNPITVLQFATTQTNCNTADRGDPEMIILSPVEQVLEDITLYSTKEKDITAHYINVVIKTEFTSTFRLDGNPVTFTPVAANPIYSYAQVPVSSGNHRLTGKGGFNAMAYGFGQVESYGYSAGANIKNLNQNITFDAQTYCEGDEVNFTGFASYEPQSWYWEFGDGNTSNEQNPKYTYTAPGTYTVKLTTTKNNGNDCDSKDETSAELIVYPNPETDFTYKSECLNGAVLFKDDTKLAGNNSQVVEWFWDFGDGNTSTEQNPRHPYSSPGNYAVKLLTKTDAGCSSETTKLVEMLAQPVLAFDAPSVCSAFEISFTDRSTSVIPVTAWSWDFGDGSPIKSGQHQSYKYAEAGTYNVTLTLLFEEGCQTSVTQQVVIHPMPQIKVELPDVCISDEAQFVNKTTISSGSLSYLWDFGDGKTSTLEHPKHKYQREGTYKVKLTATSGKGCSKELELDYTVSGANPQANFTFSGSCQRDGIQFSDNSTIAFGNIVKWEWDFGDGNDSNEQNPFHIYDEPGSYQVSLKAYSGIVCYGYVSKEITVIISPTAGFETSNVCLGEATKFKNTSFVKQGNIVSYDWGFGDGSASQEMNPTYTYTSAGTYEVTLVVTAANGCQHSFKEQIMVYERPLASFTPIIGCVSNAVNFRDGSTVATSHIISWSWSFGDTFTSTEQNPIYKYKQPGNYLVKLLVTTADGCSSEFVQNIAIKALPEAKAGPDQNPVCGQTTTELQADKPAHGTGVWTILSGNGGQVASPDNPNSVFTGKMEETYRLRWTVSNSPCTEAFDDVEIKFSAYPLANAGPDLEIIEGESITLSGKGTGTLKWSPAETLNNTTIATPVASPVENTTYTLEATSDEGCISIDDVNVRVLQRLQIPNGISPNGDGLNDVWLIKGVEDYPDISIDIYNRWGQKIYTSKGYKEPWDGTRNGMPLPDGAYYYIIDINKGRKAFTGAITVLRR